MALMEDSEFPTIVIPAYNEAPRIGKVLETLRRVNDLTAIIVVDDGSTDGTAGVVLEHKAFDSRLHLLRLWPNQGKAAAMVAGAESAPTDLLAFLDADLIGLTPAHVKQLMAPVLAGRCDMAVALFRKGRLYTDLSHVVLPSVSGQRCLRWSDYPGIADLDPQEIGYGAEMVLDGQARKEGIRCEHVIWHGMTHVTKEEKLGMRRGVRSRLFANAEIARWYLRNLWSRLNGEWRESASS